MKKSEVKKDLTKKIVLALGIGMFSIMPIVQALPTGGSSDTANISSNGTTMNISGVANNVINWQSFSIDKGETVSFDANNYLNLVHGPDISNIYGTLQGAGNIFLVNPNGIVFGSGAVINVGSLTASTAPLDTVNTAAFLTGDTASITGAVTSGSDISVALVNVQSADSLVLNAGEVVLQNTEMLDKVTKVTATDVVIGGGTADGEITLTDAQTAKLNGAYAHGAELVTDLSQITNMNGKYLLSGDIEAGSRTPIGLEAGEYGSFVNNPFNGVLNGMGYKISNLNVDTTEAGNMGTGLFTFINKGEIKNLTLADVTIKGGELTGALAGQINGTVSNVAVTGTVTGSTWHVGGLAGAIYGGKISHVTNGATVKAAAGDVGGLTGIGYGTFTNVRNTGDVSGTDYVGGIIGHGEEGTDRKSVV